MNVRMDGRWKASKGETSYVDITLNFETIHICTCMYVHAAYIQWHKFSTSKIITVYVAIQIYMLLIIILIIYTLFCHHEIACTYICSYVHMYVYMYMTYVCVNVLTMLLYR